MGLDPDPASSPNEQRISVGLVNGHYRASDNVADLHVRAGAEDAKLSAGDMLAVAEDVYTAMKARMGYPAPQPGTLILHPTGAVVIKTVVELLASAHGSTFSWGKALVYKELRARKWKTEGEPALNNKADKLHPDLLDEHFAYLDSLVGEKKVAIQPILAGNDYRVTSEQEFGQDMLLDDADGRARYEKYKKHARDNRMTAGKNPKPEAPMVSLDVKHAAAQVPKVIEVLRKLA